jgi:uncharacterized membrane protein
MNPTRRSENGSARNGRAMTLRLAAAVSAVALTAFAAGTGAWAGGWSVTRWTQVTGTSDMFMPGAGLANLDAGDLVVGDTRWDNDGDGIVFNDTHVGFLWSPATGSQVFAENDTVYWNPNFQFPAAISSDGTVVGTILFREQFKGVPFLWTAADGLNYLPLPCPGPPPDNGGGVSISDCNGGANSVSANGKVAVGISREGIFGAFPTMAIVWNATKRGKHLLLTGHRLATLDTWSNAWAVSDNGSIIVGDSGPTDTELHAVRWVNRTLQQLEAVSASSTARFTSSDGRVAVGLATDGSHNVLVRWDVDGAATVVEPPAGTTVDTIVAINPTATAAVGALSAGGNRAPYVWTLAGGFTVLPENGREQDYDMSEAVDVSDDGAVVVGSLQSSVVFNGDPPMRGFLWTSSDGMIFIDDLLTASGFPNAGIYNVPAISGDGSRILATGAFPRALTDTNSLVIELARP